MIQPNQEFRTSELVFLQINVCMQGILGDGMGPKSIHISIRSHVFYIVVSPYIISASNTVLLQIDIIFQHSKTLLSHKSGQQYIRLRIQTPTTLILMNSDDEGLCI